MEGAAVDVVVRSSEAALFGRRSVVRDWVPALGGVERQTVFSGSNWRRFAHSWASSEKTPAKIGKSALENGANWRFSDGQSAIFAVFRAVGPRSQTVTPPGFLCAESGCFQPSAARQFVNQAPFLKG
jgi:hypothetical protein